MINLDIDFKPSYTSNMAKHADKKKTRRDASPPKLSSFVNLSTVMKNFWSNTKLTERKHPRIQNAPFIYSLGRSGLITLIKYFNLLKFTANGQQMNAYGLKCTE